MATSYIPDRGDLVWLTFNPQTGHEQSGRRPALVLSPKAYNEKTGLAIFCPVTSQKKGYPFEVPLPPAWKSPALSSPTRSKSRLESPYRRIHLPIPSGCVQGSDQQVESFSGVIFIVGAIHELPRSQEEDCN